MEKYITVFLSFFCGVLITMPIISINTGLGLISVFTLFFIMFLVWMLLITITRKQPLFISNFAYIFIAWYFLALISSISGLLFFQKMPIWANMSASYIPKIIIYAVLLVVLYQHRLNKTLISSLLIGFKLGIVLNLIWVVIEGVYFYSNGKILNNIVFASYIQYMPEDRETISIVTEYGLRATGFNYDPAHIGALAPIVFMLAVINKKLSLLILSVLALIFSQSTTGAFVCILSLIAYFLISPNRYKITRKKMVQILTSLTIIVTVISLLLYFVDIPESVSKNLDGFINRSGSNYIDENHVLSPRHVYNFMVLDAISFVGLNILWGTGFGTASYPYVYDPTISTLLQIIPFPYDPESTYISYLFDLGIIGLLLYLYIILKCLFYYRAKLSNTNADIIFVSLLTIFFSGFFYHYTLTAHQILIIILAVILIKKPIKYNICIKNYVR